MEPVVEKRIIEAALYSHNDKTIYTPEDAAQKALMCQKEGAAFVHVHIYKVGGIEKFYKLADLLYENNGPKIVVSASDYNALFNENDKEVPAIGMAALDGGECIVFENHISPTYEEVVNLLGEYISKGIIPEVSIFNINGAENCVKLNELYPDKFMVGLYLNYPKEMEPTEDNLNRIIDILKNIKFKMVAILDNDDDEKVKKFLKEGFHVRCGEEDTYKTVSIGTVEEVKAMSKIIEDCGFEIAHDEKECMEIIKR